MAEKAVAISLIAVIVAAGAFAYTAVSLSPISSDIASLKKNTGGLSALQSDVSSLKSAQQTITSEQAAIKGLVEQKVGGLEKALEESKKVQAQLQEAQVRAQREAEATTKALEEAKKAQAESEAAIKQITTYDPKLVAEAMKEGTLTIYSVRDAEDMIIFSQEFQKVLPGIKVNFLTMAPTEMVARATAEYKANQRTFDLFDGSTANTNLLVELGAYQAYKSPQATSDNFPLIDTAGKQTLFGFTNQVIVYNTKTVTKEELAIIKSVKEWDDITKPQFINAFKGSVVMDTPSRAGPHGQILAELQVYWKNDARWTNHMKGLMALQPRLFAGTGILTRLVIAEEAKIGVSALAHDVFQAKARGAPVELFSPIPLVSGPSGLVINKLAPHPNAAKLFVEFMLSPQGQAAYAKTLRTPARLGFVASTSLNVLFPNIPKEAIVGIYNTEFQTSPTPYAQKYFFPIFGPP